MRAARVLVVGETVAEAEETAGVLRSRGFETAASSNETALAELLASRRPDVVLFDRGDDTSAHDNDNIELFADAIRETALWQHLPFIILGDSDSELLPGDAALLVDRLGDDALPAELDHRIKAVARLAVMRAEVERRARTLKRLGIATTGTLQPPAFVNDPVILIVGAGRGALKVQSAYSEGPRFIGAPTVNLALDILEQNRVDAVVIDATSDIERASETLATLRRIATWTRLPALVLVSEDGPVAQMHEQGASEVLPLECEDARLVSRLHLLIREHRYGDAIQRHFREDGHIPHDPGCPLATREFALAHLIELVEGCDRNGDALSLVAVAVSAQAGAEKVASAFAGALARMVRGEDLAARVSDGLFLIMLPGTDLRVAQHVRERIERVVAATDFGACEDGTAVSASLRFSLQSYQPGDTSDTLLARTLEALA